MRSGALGGSRGNRGFGSGAGVSRRNFLIGGGGGGRGPTNMFL